MSWEKFWVLLSSHKSGLKALLMDQEFVAGIGNMYADEILFAAGLRYDRLSNSLSSQEVRRLYRAMVETLAEAVKRRGSSLADEQYRDLFGEIGRLPGPAPGLRPRRTGLPALPGHHREGQVRRAVDLLLRALPGLTTGSAVRDGHGPSSRRVTWRDSRLYPAGPGRTRASIVPRGVDADRVSARCS